MKPVIGAKYRSVAQLAVEWVEERVFFPEQVCNRDVLSLQHQLAVLQSRLTSVGADRSEALNGLR